MPCGDDGGGGAVNRQPCQERFREASSSPRGCPYWVPRASVDWAGSPPPTGMAVHGVFLKSSVIHFSIVQSTSPCQEGRTLLHKTEYRQDLHNGAGPAPLPSSRRGKGLRMVLWCSCIASRQKHLSGILCKCKIARQRLEIKGEL